jgi:4-methyl-5(b-hydroxyethyl)-thiazole monophosphate biosynthesis
MTRALVPLAPGFEEIEAVTIVDVLRRAGIEVTLAGLQEGPLEGSRGVRVVPDRLLGEEGPEDFDVVVLPGGTGGALRLGEDERVQGLLRRFREKERLTAAICAAPTVLQDLGFLQGARATSHPAVSDRMTGVDYVEDRVVVDGRLVTSRAAGTAMEFALKLVEILEGRKRMEAVKRGLLARS